MSLTDSQRRANNKYKQTHIKRIPLDVPVEFYEQIKTYAIENGYTVNGLIKEAIQVKIENN